MATLHCIDTPPKERLGSITSHFATSDIVLILDDSTLALEPYRGLIEYCSSAGIELYVLSNPSTTEAKTDLLLTSVDYEGWVVLSERCEKQVHW
ncbi:MAG: hypothetical protein AAF749_15040 [Pseudomonadota bacterium]